MKQIVWGGFCLLAGILLFWMLTTLSIDIDHGVIDALLTFSLKAAAAALGLYGFVLGLKGLRAE